MKNILAENMLRFNPKNLHKSDIKKIQEAIINEDVVINGVTYKFPFRNADHLNTSYLGNAAPWNESAAIAAGRFDRMADASTIATLRALYGDMLLLLAQKGTTPQILKANSDRVRYVVNLLSTAARTPEGMAMVKQKGGWANYDAIRQNVLGNGKVHAWVSNWFIPTFEKAFATAFPQGIPTATPNPQAPGAPKPGM